jgi:tetratricopeptide (TPR) repeat protein
VSPSTGPPPLRVEQALRLLPDVDVLAPFRAFLVGASRSKPPVEPYHTVGKRLVPLSELRELVSRAVGRVTDHLSALYEAAVQALEAEQRGDMSGVVRALLGAGSREEAVGRDSQARAWYEHALRVAEELRDRQPEVDALLHLGHLDATRGQPHSGARRFQRALALADAERELSGAARACQGLGDVAQSEEQWQGAESWYTRGLRYAEQDRVLTGRLWLGLAEVARQRGQTNEAADRLRRAQRIFDELNHEEGAVRVLNAWGLFEAKQQRHAEALGHYRNALAWLLKLDRHPGLELAIRLNVCELYLSWGKLRDAEDEIRAAEEQAISYNHTRLLARLYVVMGKVLGRQGDETGFVFFEKAIELCRGSEPLPRAEAEVYAEYGRFRNEVGEREEARGYLERAREIFHSIGDERAASRIEDELSRIPPQ